MKQLVTCSAFLDDFIFILLLLKLKIIIHVNKEKLIETIIFKNQIKDYSSVLSVT